MNEHSKLIRIAAEIKAAAAEVWHASQGIEKAAASGGFDLRGLGDARRAAETIRRASAEADSLIKEIQARSGQ